MSEQRPPDRDRSGPSCFVLPTTKPRFAASVGARVATSSRADDEGIAARHVAMLEKVDRESAQRAVTGTSSREPRDEEALADRLLEQMGRVSGESPGRDLGDILADRVGAPMVEVRGREGGERRKVRDLGDVIADRLGAPTLDGEHAEGGSRVL